MKSFSELINSNKPVLVDFSAEWCGPCKMMAPVIKELSSEVGNSAKVIKVDVDRNPKAAAKYEIRGVPTFILFKQGKVLWRHSGAVPKEMLKNAIMSNSQ
jgi:thioredoxin 1